MVLEEGPVEREGNAEECWISLRLGRSVTLLLHYFATGSGYTFPGLLRAGSSLYRFKESWRLAGRGLWEL